MKQCFYQILDSFFINLRETRGNCCDLLEIQIENKSHQQVSILSSQRKTNKLLPNDLNN